MGSMTTNKTSIQKEEWKEEKEMMTKNGGGFLFLKAMMSEKEIPGSTSQMTPIQNATSGQHAWSAWRQRSIKNLMSKLGRIK